MDNGVSILNMNPFNIIDKQDSMLEGTIKVGACWLVLPLRDDKFCLNTNFNRTETDSHEWNRMVDDMIRVTYNRYILIHKDPLCNGFRFYSRKVFYAKCLWDIVERKLIPEKLNRLTYTISVTLYFPKPIEQTLIENSKELFKLPNKPKMTMVSIFISLVFLLLTHPHIKRIR